MGDDERGLNILFINGGLTMQNNITKTDNSISIGSNTSLTGVQFAHNSENFKGVIEINKDTKSNLEKITEELIRAISQERELNGADPEEIIDAINQANDEVKKEKTNKLSLKGIVSGIHIVMNDIHNISSVTHEIYSQWYDMITTVFN